MLRLLLPLSFGSSVTLPVVFGVAFFAPAVQSVFCRFVSAEFADRQRTDNRTASRTPFEAVWNLVFFFGSDSVQAVRNKACEFPSTLVVALVTCAVPMQPSLAKVGRIGGAAFWAAQFKTFLFCQVCLLVSDKQPHQLPSKVL
jgi:hypothetical protein